MKIEGTLVEGRFLVRDNRFRVTVEVRGREAWAHLPNSGRLGELLVPGRRAILIERLAAGRRTGYDLNLIEHEGRWVSVDARLPNDLVEESLVAGQLEPLAGYASLRREVTFGRSRFDFLLESDGRPPCLVEVKSITLVIDGLGCFPDAVTARGRRHVTELAQALCSGYRAAVVFCVQREDATGMRPHDESDPDFAQALRDAAAQGVEVYAYACRVEPGKVEIARPLPVHLALA
ncbi:MAG: DNA/RNA nuclease SfsA [Anaerolineae bacterium]|jgi:sugar fermentation stimulation protein A